MPGSVVEMKDRKLSTEVVEITPKMAVDLLEMNEHNRSISDQHVKRIARQIAAGKWRFNGDTIKIAGNAHILDGQHRLWACVEAKKPIKTIVVRGIDKEAFATLDTIRKVRSGADTLSLHGVTRYRGKVSEALKWLLRYQRKCLEDYKAPENRIENSDIEDAWRAHPYMVNAIERCAPLRHIGNTNILGFIYYVVTNRNPELAERFVITLENPARVSVNDPLFKFRAYLTQHTDRPKDSAYTIALAFKALNAAKTGRKIERLLWNRQGSRRETFPELKV